jgi:hypothetical protein
MSSFNRTGSVVLPGFPALGFSSGDYIPPALAGILVESGATVQDVAYAVPYVVDTPTNVNAIVYRNNDAAALGQKVRAGLYRFTARGIATQLQAAAERTLTGAAVTNEDAITTTQLLPGFRYAAVVVFNSATVIARIDNDTTVGQAIMRSFNSPASKLFVGDMTPANWPANVFGVLSMTHAYAALPATFTATSITTSAAPFVSLKVA